MVSDSLPLDIEKTLAYLEGMSDVERKALVIDLLKLQLRNGNRTRNYLLYEFARFVHSPYTIQVCTTGDWS